MRQFRTEQIGLLPPLLKWLFLASIVGLLVGTASAAFLVSLDAVTAVREHDLWLIALLPAAGYLMAWAYLRAGKDIEAGSNLIIDEIHEPRTKVPFRMTPMIFLASVLTHLFGGSAGREGTAVQMGGSLADQLTRPLRLTREDRRIVLMAGMSGGFASIFGTPMAGAFFGLEVLSVGRLRYDAIFPCLIAAVTGDLVARSWGIHHDSYRFAIAPSLTEWGILYACLAGIGFGIVGMIFSRATHGIAAFYRERFSYAPTRALVGGAVVALLVAAAGTTRYIGLGIPAIQESFHGPVPAWDFAAKILMTALTLGAGFKGGEVTPLFFIGATFGNALGAILPLPLPLLAAMGFVGVFAGAANTPWACTLMGIELFGAENALYMAIACVVSYLFSGHAGIYRAQRLGSSKHQAHRDHEGKALRDLE